MPVMQGDFGKCCRMLLRPLRNERHQIPKSDFLYFRFAASIYALSGLGLSKGIERATIANPKGASFSPLAFKCNHVCAMSSKTVMAITDAPSRFWHEQDAIRRGLHEYKTSPWISRGSDGTVRHSAR